MNHLLFLILTLSLGCMDTSEDVVVKATDPVEASIEENTGDLIEPSNEEKKTPKNNDVPPNFVIILADDIGQEALEVYGGSSYKTPNLSRMAKEGMTFRNAHSNPVCTPTRNKIMTGRYNINNYEGFGILRKGEVTFANLVKDSGYKTFVGGKWQLATRKGSGQTPEEAGFDEYFLWSLTNQYRNRGSRYWDPTFIDNRGRNEFPGEYGPELINRRVLDFIDENKKNPFLVYYTMVLPHSPFENPPGFEGESDGEKFSGMVAYMDKMVGRVLKKLDALKLSEKTLVIFMGDNGTNENIESMMKGKLVKGGKSLTIDTGTHVPFIAKWPGVIEADSQSADIIDFATVLPTVADLAKIDVPANIDGRSLTDYFAGEKAAKKEWVYIHYVPRPSVKDRPTRTYAMTKKFKLYDHGPFYNYSEDPEEKSPLTVGKLNKTQKAIHAMLKKIIKNNGHLAGCMDRSSANYNRNADIPDPSACK